MDFAAHDVLIRTPGVVFLIGACGDEFKALNSLENYPVLTSSHEIRRRLEREGWVLIRSKGSHHIFRNPDTGVIISLPHPKKDLGRGLVNKIYRDANWPKD